ncbi:hypothetical protein ACFVUS_12620 [Nocardia sp. NPDC058058]|uniref:hypothetical protein n=1 Tax=Nocardia sp. NPDC058058 TaxID=3346317 RepID=UPI0036DB106C
MHTARTIYSWHEIYNLRPETRFIDSQGHEFTAKGEGQVTHCSGDFAMYSDIELPVTVLEDWLGKLRVRKLGSLPRWAAIGHGIYESFDSHREAVFWAHRRARQ